MNLYFKVLLRYFILTVFEILFKNILPMSESRVILYVDLISNQKLWHNAWHFEALVKVR